MDFDSWLTQGNLFKEVKRLDLTGVTLVIDTTRW